MYHFHFRLLSKTFSEYFFESIHHLDMVLEIKASSIKSKIFVPVMSFALRLVIWTSAVLGWASTTAARFLTPSPAEAHLKGKHPFLLKIKFSSILKKKISSEQRYIFSSFIQPNRNFSRLHSHRDLNSLSLSTGTTNLLGLISLSWHRPAPYLRLPPCADASGAGGAMQCDAVCCSVFQCAPCCSVLQRL